MTALRYSRGTDTFDSHPEVREVADFAAFERAVLADRAPVKGKQYVAAPFKINGDGRPHRGKEEVEARRFLALDCDHIFSHETYTALRLWLSRFRGFGFTTASSKPDAPRCRVILELDREIDRTEGIALGAALARDIAEEFGERVKLDPTTHRGEQPCYGPVIHSETFRLDGEPLDVDAWLEKAPPIELDRKGSAAIDPNDDPVIVALKQRTLYKRAIGNGKHAIECPWADAHTAKDDARSTATIYVQPYYGGYKTAGFKCQHAHCAKRTGDDLLSSLKIDWRIVADAYNPKQQTTESSAGDGDPPPIDILRPLAAPPLRIEDVPDVLAKFADAHARATGFDVSILLTGGIAAAAAAISDDVRLCVSSRAGWFESARLWAVVIGGPGSGKTPGFKLAMAPVYALHRELLGKWADEHGEKEEKDAPPKPALYTSDSTTEALADILRDNERGLLYFVDELESWLASHDAYRGAGGGKDRGEWLRLYDGGPHQVNRVRRGSFFVKNWGASLLSATTPAALSKLAPKLPADGLLQRLMLVIVQARTLPNAAMLSVETKYAAEAWDETLRRLYARPGCVVRLSEAAREAFDTEQAELHRATLAFEDLHPSFAAHMAKRTGMLARLALTFHALEAQNITDDVSGPTMQRAVRFLRRQERHAQAVYASLLGADTGMELAKSVAKSILAAGLQNFNRRDLTHCCKAFRGADEHTRLAALSFLSDCGWTTCTAPAAAHGALWTVDERVHALFSKHREAAIAQRETVRARIQGTSS